jgi:hypothetical protein
LITILTLPAMTSNWRKHDVKIRTCSYFCVHFSYFISPSCWRVYTLICTYIQLGRSSRCILRNFRKIAISLHLSQKNMKCFMLLHENKNCFVIGRRSLFYFTLLLEMLSTVIPSFNSSPNVIFGLYKVTSDTNIMYSYDNEVHSIWIPYFNSLSVPTYDKVLYRQSMVFLVDVFRIGLIFSRLYIW